MNRVTFADDYVTANMSLGLSRTETQAEHGIRAMDAFVENAHVNYEFMTLDVRPAVLLAMEGNKDSPTEWLADSRASHHLCTDLDSSVRWRHQTNNFWFEQLEGHNL